MAMTLNDLLWRRLRIGFGPGQGVKMAPKIARFLGERGHWDEARIASEVEAYTKRIAQLNAEFKKINLVDNVQLSGLCCRVCTAHQPLEPA